MIKYKNLTVNSDEVYTNLFKIASNPDIIFDTQTITIKIAYMFKGIGDEGIDYAYTIKCIEKDGLKDDYIDSLVDSINKKIVDFYDKNNYKENSWTVFYLLKELIKQLTNPSHKVYNYFRGQNRGWPTVPSIFRDISLSPEKKGNFKHSKYYENFEAIYKAISKRYPNEIQYFEIPDPDRDDSSSLEDRADQLAILQHYELKTSLLDITENPFIAMLFMATTTKPEDIVFEPQLECYRLDYDSPLFYEAKKLENNKRIKVQKGAFLNYDTLLQYFYAPKVTGNSDKFSEAEFKEIRIPRVIIKLQIDFDNMKKEFEEHCNSESESSKSLEESQDYGNSVSVESDNTDGKKIRDIFDENNKIVEANADPFYKTITNELLKKLNEYNYYYDELFPDLVDYIEKNINLNYS